MSDEPPAELPGLLGEAVHARAGDPAAEVRAGEVVRGPCPLGKCDGSGFLIDTDGSGVERFTKTGVVVDGQEYELDCVVFATGFEVGTEFTKRARYDAVGRDGVRLSSKWANGASTFHGFYTEGFPNMFFLGITQTGLTINFPHMLNEQTQHLAHVVRHCRARAC